MAATAQERIQIVGMDVRQAIGADFRGAERVGYTVTEKVIGMRLFTS